ncbi:MAG: methionyl-tRNA formyltransferase [Solirubrobacterales bacterium]
MSRTVFLGTSPFAAVVLDALASSPHRPSLVITPPDRPRGRGRLTLPPPVAQAAREAGLDLVQTEDVGRGKAVEAIRAADPEIVCLCAFGQIVREPLLSEFTILGVHPSLLPRWRGAAPIERAIMAGDSGTGTCVMRVIEELDAGPVAACGSLDIGPEETFGELSARLAELGSRLLLEVLERFRRGEIELTPQAARGITYAEKIEPAERALDPSEPAEALARVVRALTPHVGAYLDLGGGARLGVRSARADPVASEPGLLDAEEDEIVLGCGEGSLRIAEVQPPSSRWMDAAAYLRGHRPPARVPLR